MNRNVKTGYEMIRLKGEGYDLKRSNMKKTFPGVHVVTPFILSNGQGKILVDRGWSDLDHLDQKTRIDGQIEDEVEVVGLIRHSEEVDFWTQLRELVLPPKLVENGFLHRDVKSMAESKECHPVYIELVKESEIPGGPIAGQVLIDNYSYNHEYALNVT